MEKKLRIQLFDKDGRLVNDRMVSQDSELYSGPNDCHDGPMRIEFTLDNKYDISKAKDYLDKLVGNLPINASTKKPKKEKVFNIEDNREVILGEAIEIGDKQGQDAMMSFLREKGFVFMMSDFLKSFNFEILQIKERHLEKYQWMVYCSRRAKNPKSDKYDPMLVFGFQLLPQRDNEKVIVYLNGEFNSTYKFTIPETNALDFKKTNMVKFPHYMVPEEREKFRYELRQYQDDPEKPLSKFFLRWVEYVENIPNLPQLS